MHITVETLPEMGKNRLDIYLAEALSDLSRSRIQALIKDNAITVNLQPAKAKQALSIGDQIHLIIPDAPPSKEILPENIPLRILYEDSHLLVIDKTPGLVVHPAAGNETGTLVNALLHHCQGQLLGVGDTQRPGIVHRLDKDTSGCLVAAKTNQALLALQSQFANRTTSKHYLLLTQSPPSKPEGTIFTNLGRHPIHRQKMVVVNPGSGREAITDYQLLYDQPENHTCLILCHLLTGRTHQIRVHMKHLGTPILGDPIYANPSRQPINIGRLALHAWHLAFDHPSTNERLTFEAPIPSEFTPWTTPIHSTLESRRTFFKEKRDP